jgi:hypothetical protein
MMKNILSALALVLLAASAACRSQPDVDKVPVGSDVELTREDGGVISGKLAARDEQTLQVKSKTATRSVPRNEIADVRVVDDTKPAPPLPPIARFREFTVPAGTRLAVQLNSAVASDTSRVEQAVEATLTESVLVDGTTVFPAGSIVRGEVAGVEPSGKVKGLARLALRFHSIAVEGHDAPYTIAARIARTASSTKKEDAAKIAIPGGAGAIIGGIVGGKKGAAIGGAIGGGAGTAVVLSTTGEEVRMPSGTRLTLPLDEAIEVRVPIGKT